jgi:hypothetical protein
MSQQPDDLPPAAPGDDDGAGLPLIELETLLARPPSPRKRLVQIGLVLAACVVVLVTFWKMIVPPGPPPKVVFIAPTPTPRTVSIVSNTNYGTLTINGKTQRAAPPLTVTVRDQQPYTITLNAPPFQPRTCQFPPTRSIVPYGFHPCNAGQTIFQDQDALTMLEIFLTLADLPTAQQQQITSLIAQKLTFQQTLNVPAQSRIVTGIKQDGTLTTRRVAEPLTARVSLVPSMDHSQQGVFCLSFTCIGPGAFYGPVAEGGQYWQVQTPIALRWQFTTASGQVVSDVSFPTSPELLTLLLAYGAADGWRIAPQSSSPDALSQQLNQLACSTGVQMLALQQARSLIGEGWNISMLRNQGVAGCELALTRQGVDQGHFIWRFGALLAADAKAQKTLPMLPRASADDAAAVEG